MGPYSDVQTMAVWYTGALAVRGHDYSPRHRISRWRADVGTPKPSNVLEVKVAAGQGVKRAGAQVVLKGMKMEHTLTAPFDGVLAELNANAGAQVSEGVVLAKLEKA